MKTRNPTHPGDAMPRKADSAGVLEIGQCEPLHGCRTRWPELRHIILASAATHHAVPAMAAEGTALSGGSLLQVVLGLGIVLAVMAGSAWLLKRFGAMQRSQRSAVRVIGGSAVGQRERVVLVEVGNTWLVVGVAPGHVTALHSMPRGQAQGEPGLSMETEIEGTSVINSGAGETGMGRECGGQEGMNAPFSVWFKHLLEKCSGELRK